MIRERRTVGVKKGGKTKNIYGMRTVTRTGTGQKEGEGKKRERGKGGGRIRGGKERVKIIQRGRVRNGTNGRERMSKGGNGMKSLEEDVGRTIEEGSVIE